MRWSLERWLVTGAAAIFALVTLAPLLWMLSVSFMAPGEAAAFPPPLIPSVPTLENYRELFVTYGIGKYFGNSLLLATLATLLALMFTVPAGYAFAKLRFKGRDRIFQALVGALVIPGQIGMLPLFLMLKGMGLVNSYAGALVPWLAGIFGIFLVRQYCLSIPDEMLEAARVDGASEGRIFTSIVLPMLHADPRHAGAVRVPRQLERFHVAADHPGRSGSLYAAGRTRRALPRACPGQRADDGGQRGDDAAGADPVPRRCSAST